MSDQIRASARKQLRALRATVAAVIGQLDALESTLGGAEEECEHDEGDRRSLATFDDPERWQCKRCGYLHQGPSKPEPEKGS